MRPFAEILALVVSLALTHLLITDVIAPLLSSWSIKEHSTFE